MGKGEKEFCPRGFRKEGARKDKEPIILRRGDPGQKKVGNNKDNQLLKTYVQFIYVQKITWITGKWDFMANRLSRHYWSNMRSQDPEFCPGNSLKLGLDKVTYLQEIYKA